MATVHHRTQAALAPLLARIAGFSELEPDWDSYGSARPTPQALDAAARSLQRLVEAYAPDVGDKALPFWVSPLPNGGVQLEWRGPAADLEVEVGPRGELGYLLQEGHGTNATYEEGDDVSLPDILLHLRRVVAP